jgi:class 3 adenylate cyclase/pimeloyl-ACP methyl ester carboxylesterase
VSGGETRYARTEDGAYIAYQVTGEGPPDLLVLFGPGLSIEDQVTGRLSGPFIDRLTSFARVIRLDRRGYGLSDSISTVDSTSWELWADDLVTVLDTVGSEQTAVLSAESSTGIVSMLFAAAHPHRVSHLMMFNPTARWVQAPDYPYGFPESEVDGFVELFVAAWVDGARPPLHLPTVEDDPDFWSWWAASRRRGMSPSMARAVYRNGLHADVRSVLPTIGVPTLVLHRDTGVAPFVGLTEYVAEHIASARLVGLPGEDAMVFVGDIDPVVEEIEEFVTGTRSTRTADRVLATVLFTDIESSTERAVTLGDQAWRDLLDRFRSAVREQLDRYRGREINTRGDDFLATFDGPARAIQCALAVIDAAAELGVGVCSGLHTGEIELMGDDIGGIAVHIGARVAALARPSEVLVSRTVVDLVAGSGIEFTDRGEHELRGVPGSWRLFAVSPSAARATR